MGIAASQEYQWNPRKMLGKGEYDLVNISLIGFDPNSGETYDSCHERWQAALAEAQEWESRMTWWNIPFQIKWRIRVAAVASRFSMGY